MRQLPPFIVRDGALGEESQPHNRSASQPREPTSLTFEAPQHACGERLSSSLDKYVHRLGARSVGFRWSSGLFRFPWWLRR